MVVFIETWFNGYSRRISVPICKIDCSLQNIILIIAAVYPKIKGLNVLFAKDLYLNDFESVKGKAI